MVYPPGFVLPPPPPPPPPPPSAVTPGRVAVVGVGVLCVGLLALLLVPRALRHQRAENRPPVVRLAPETVQTFGGRAEMDLPVITLGGGNYDLAYRSGPGSFFVRLRSTDEEVDEDAVSVDTGPSNGTARVANLPAGQYHVHVAGEGDAPWAIQVIPR